MWITLSDDLFFFGAGGITAIKKIDLRDKPPSFIMRTELYANNTRIALVSETVDDIQKLLEGGSK